MSPQVTSRVSVFNSLVPDKKANSEKPTMTLSEYKKDRKIVLKPMHPKVILRMYVRDTYMVMETTK
jgi:hypothetical protein